jgi:hypothetical protein
VTKKAGESKLINNPNMMTCFVADNSDLISAAQCEPMSREEIERARAPKLTFHAGINKIVEDGLQDMMLPTYNALIWSAMVSRWK